MRALRIILKALLNLALHLVTVTALPQCRDQLLSLLMRQFRHQFIKPL
jgi:hypothetical protein